MDSKIKFNQLRVGFDVGGTFTDGVLVSGTEVQ
jgi:N-methylhydantoinase A/oxoprolinase/acetone carboxylase beta subunit